MLYDINHYYQKSRESGIKSMDCRISACIFYPLTCQVRYWPEVKTYEDYIRKCYNIAKEVPVDELRDQYSSLRFRNKIALEILLRKVQIALNELNQKNLNDSSMGYTPITHIQAQLSQLEAEISAEIGQKKTSLSLLFGNY